MKIDSVEKARKSSLFRWNERLTFAGIALLVVGLVGFVCLVVLAILQFFFPSLHSYMSGLGVKNFWAYGYAMFVTFFFIGLLMGTFLTSMNNKMLGNAYLGWLMEIPMDRKDIFKPILKLSLLYLGCLTSMRIHERQRAIPPLEIRNRLESSMADEERLNDDLLRDVVLAVPGLMDKIMSYQMKWNPNSERFTKLNPEIQALVHRIFIHVKSAYPHDVPHIADILREQLAAEALIQDIYDSTVSEDVALPLLRGMAEVVEHTVNALRETAPAQT